MKVGSGQFNSITKEFCEAEVGLFQDKTNFLEKGGLNSMDKAMEHGMVLVLSLWDDHDVNMLWLDSDYPTDQPTSKPGVARGSCATTSGKPSDVETNHPDSSVTFSNIRFGEIGSTDGGAPGPSPGPAPGPSPSGCPGGSLSACMNLCPTDPTAFQACVKVCEQKCAGESVVV
jgi:cellulose 1,4-beta-cellobiosidase